ncbi:hypothetical protein CH330_05055 [candidate division WOR-3 bacterium JGI_Cruoil_03_51_56]|uniref:Uncharacterized protein n=1 Tax=candidate division WOR-3 bacterium JGI_Cruoil_03_51_56 TaxID=1973747 RepID=A0A235BV98_UNCW3|nr:MAG: hypothetical protein CH330_05055 [candidate division WOR-3 bacterium JGI_Cruoil_03_51_56]
MTIGELQVSFQILQHCAPSAVILSELPRIIGRVAEFGFVTLFLAGLAGAGSLENIPTDPWVYADLDLLKTSGLIRSMVSTSRPWTRTEAAVLGCVIWLGSFYASEGNRRSP